MTFIQWWASKLGKIEVVSESNFKLMQEAYNTGQAAQAETIAQLEHALVSEAVNKKDYAQLQLDNEKLSELLSDVHLQADYYHMDNGYALRDRIEEALGERK